MEMKDNYIRKTTGKEPVMLVNHMDEVEYLTFQGFYDCKDIKHLFTTRIGGVSKGIFSSMNMSYIRGDEKSAVDENYARIAKVFGLTIEHFVCSDQTHTTNIRIVTERDKGKGTVVSKDYTDIDGLITDCKDLILGTSFADCVPLFFVDEGRKVIGLAHAGWRGTVDGIGAKMVELLVSEMGCTLSNIKVAIGPSICQECYEISEDVAEQFKTRFRDEEEQRQILIDKGYGKYQLDLWRSNELILQSAGIKAENILVTDICTCCNPDRLFSHRASQGKRGNLGAFMCIKS